MGQQWKVNRTCSQAPDTYADEQPKKHAVVLEEDIEHNQTRKNRGKKKKEVSQMRRNVNDMTGSTNTSFFFFITENSKM